MIDRTRRHIVSILRWTERYTKTDMVYLASGSLWLNLDFLVSSGSAFLLSIIFASLLPKSEYGIYQYVLSVVGILTAFSLTGMNPAVSQAVARGREGLFKRSIPIQLWYSIPSSLIALCIGAYYFFQHNTGLSLVMVITAFALPFINTASTYQAFFTGRRDFKRYFFYDTIFNVTYVVLMGAIMVFNRSGDILAISYLILTMIINGSLCLYTLLLANPNDLQANENINYAKHLSFMGILGTVANRIDSVLIFHFLGPTDLAIYSLAKIIPEKLGGLAKSISSLAFPKLAAKSDTEFAPGMLRKILFLGFSSLGVAAVYAITVPLIFHIFFPAYASAIPYSMALSLILLGAAANLPITALVARTKKRELYILNTIYPVAQIITIFVFLAWFGLWGIVIARILSSLFFSVLSTTLFLSYVRKHILKTPA